MHAVAKLAGLSRTTVSDVVNNRWREKGITRHTYDRVQKLIAKYNYRPNMLARSLAAGKTYTIGVQLPSSMYEHWNAVHKNLDAAFRRHGYHLALASASWFHDAEEDEIRRLCDRQVDGLILSPQNGMRLHSLFKWIQQRGIPFVFIGSVSLPHYFAVVDDNSSNARLAVEHLIRLGHERIAYLHSTSRTLGERERRRGYLQTLRDHGLRVHREYLGWGYHDFDQSRQAMLRMLDLSEPPTAIYCGADTMALGVIDAILARGMRVPDDVAVVGQADDIAFISQYRVPLTTIRQPRQQLAENAVRMLLDLIEGRTPAQSLIRLPGELIIRDSCGGLKQAR
ncbi:MAG: LacI family DNA-binding transcriptional regulator [Phycisphaerales bacterium]|nr:LacI family DNA-binding transcriptional regulator [Phycisphaerales bacterium]